MNDSITAYAPASVSNVACGFDIMGFALEQPGDRVTLRRTRQPGISITRISGCNENLSKSIERNTAAPPVVALAKEHGITDGIAIEVEKGYEPGSGLGSSAASAVAAAMAFNELFSLGLTKHQILPFALKGEMLASGTMHADNVAPSLFGGFVLIRSYDPIDIISLRTPPSLRCAVIHPQIAISTRESRKLLPKAIPMKDFITQTGNASGLVAGLLMDDLALVRRSLHDVVAEPARAHTIPGFHAMQKAAMDAGALGCSISGSGPSLFAFAEGEAAANRVAGAMAAVAATTGIRCTTYVSHINTDGARIED